MCVIEKKQTIVDSNPLNKDFGLVKNKVKSIHMYTIYIYVFLTGGTQVFLRSKT